MKRLCLVIAAEEEVRESARAAASRLGLLCIEAEDGEYAYVASQALMPDFFLVDLDDVNDSGQELIGNLRRLHRGDRPVIICCMTEKDKNVVAHALQSGADGIILKPLDFDGLASQIMAEWKVRVFADSARTT